MPIDVSSLLKILQFEVQKGYNDTAVIGGMDKFLRNWTGRSIGSLNSPQLVRKFQKLHVSNPGYAKMSQKERQVWLKGLVDLIDEVNQADSNRDGVVEKVPAKTPKKNPSPGTLSPVTAGTGLESPITVVKGVGPNLTGRLNKVGVRTVRDLLFYFPNRHIDYSRIKTVSQLAEGDETIIANVWEANVNWLGRRRSTEAVVGDATGNVRAVWFNNPYVARALTPNMKIVISGRVRLFNGRFVFESPEWEPVEEGDLTHTGRLVPVYPLTEGLHQRQLRKILKTAVDGWTGFLQDFLPPSVRSSAHLVELKEAVAQAHYPDDVSHKDTARTRLAFDELFLLQLGVLEKKRVWRDSQPGIVLKTDRVLLDKLVRTLLFTLTAAQNRVLGEILDDMVKPQAMSRLLQGDVGSGKTVVATAALLMTVANGYQGALMAPTEILAEQHFATVHGLLSRLGQVESEENKIYRYSGILPRPLTVGLLIGAVSAKRKRELQASILNGDIDIIIGTHALIEQGVEFKRLGFVVVDEQHRFGVEQRSSLRQKGANPHMLVMTATPIPRTLALTLYGDLDLSVIDELPPGRQVIKTKWLKPNQRDSAYNFIRKEIAATHQAFIICPLIEESEAVQARAAVAEFERLSREVFPDLRLSLLHGRMSSSDKEQTMLEFKNRTTNILVSTPVIEVGIDIPNATVMMVESADRFGLSQLHQFRGRVGRGEAQSYCILLSENPSDIGQERLSIIETVQDGFKLAEEDLKLRGPGEFFGTRQSGLPDLRMARLSDVAILEMARREAEKLFARDPRLKQPENQLLVKELSRVWTTEAGEWS